MIKSRMQLNALIKNKAAGNGDKAQILLRIYMMERLLERISISRYRDNFILKGGMLGQFLKYHLRLLPQLLRGVGFFPFPDFLS